MVRIAEPDRFGPSISPHHPHGHQSHTGIRRDEHHDEIHPPTSHRLSAAGVVCLILDDCHLAQLEVMRRARNNDQRMSLAVTWKDQTNSFGYSLGNASNMLGVSDLDKAVQWGHELLNHTYRHIDMGSASAAVRAAAMDDLTADLVANGLPEPSFFAFPFGTRSYWAERDIVSRFRGFRYSGPGAITSRMAAADSFRIPGVQMHSDTDPTPLTGNINVSHARALVRRAVHSPIVVTLVNHLGPTYVGSSEPTVAEYLDFLDYVAELGVPCVTLSEAFAGGNRVTDPNFDDDGGSFSGWPIFGVTASGSSSVVAVTPYTGGGGDHALRLTAPAAGDGAERGQRIEVTPGETIWPAFRYKFASGGTSASTFAADTMATNTTDGLANAGTGGAYTLVGTAADFDEASGKATIVAAAGSSHRAILTTPSQADVDATIRWQYSVAPSGGNLDVLLTFRDDGANNYCAVIFEAGAFGIGILKLVKVVAGVQTVLQTWGNPVVLPSDFQPPGNAATTWYHGRVQAVGDTIRIKWWLETDESEPDFWTFVSTGTSIPTAAGGLGWGVTAAAGISNGPITVSFDDWSVKTADGVSSVGLRGVLYELDANGLVVGTFGTPASTAYRNVNRAGWEQLAFDAPITLGPWTRYVEYRAKLSGLAATVDVNNFLLAPKASQPNGPLG